ncbi:substrate-binding domain-containing protein [Aestuariivirga sp.]|uniref:substrate-binding domain-containing protein n=1 Tax=Aestuariivirga sp. TaxID=2650926 RepID=UPI0035B3F6C5
MKNILIILAMLAVTPGMALAGTRIGVSMPRFDDTFLAVLQGGMAATARAMQVELHVESAQNDVARQIAQIRRFAAADMEAVIVVPVDTTATQAMSDAAAAAHVPLVYVNRQPINLDTLPDTQAFVGSNEDQSGTLQTAEVCRLLKEAGKAEAQVYVMMGDLANQAAVQRTQDVHDVIVTGQCAVTLVILDEQSANWSREQARTLMNSWIAAGKPFDAVIANNDAMALGAIEAMKAAGVDAKTVVVGGIDATRDGLAAMQAGELDVTVFQDAAAQGARALDAAVRLAHAERAERKVHIPFELVTPDNMAGFLGRN